jgi:polar amino acid transport system substrate-binding protein
MKSKMLPAYWRSLFAAVALFLFGAAASAQQGAAPKAEQSTDPKSVAAQTPPATPRGGSDFLSEIKRSGKLRVGVSEIVPWATHDKDGNLVGFEIDVAKKLARDIGVEPEFYPEEFRYLIPDLLAGRFDIIISGLSINASRALQVDFSAPYNTTDVTLAANVKAAGSLPTLKSFDKESVTVGVLEGTTAEDMAGDSLPNAKIRTYTDDEKLFDDLIQGKLEAAVADSPRPDIVAKLYPANVVCVCDAPLATYPAAFAVRRGNLEFINFLNSWIQARTASKWLEERRTYWFKNTDWTKDL